MNPKLHSIQLHAEERVEELRILLEEAGSIYHFGIYGTRWSVLCVLAPVMDMLSFVFLSCMLRWRKGMHPSLKENNQGQKKKIAQNVKAL